MTADTAASMRLEAFPATPTQVGMVVNSVRDRGVEIEQLVVRFAEPIPLGALRDVFESVHTRHPVLRSAFRWEGPEAGGGMLQEVFRHAPLEVVRSAGELREFLDADRARGFDPRRPPLHRATLLARAEHAAGEGDVLVWTFHHAILDGRSYRRVLEEVLDGLEGAPAPAPPRASFSDYCRSVAEAERSASLAYFSRALEGATTTPVPAVRTSDAPRAHTETTWRLADLAIARAGAEQAGVSIANMIQAAWAWVLARRGRVEDVVFATTRSGRLPSFPDVKEVVGCLVGTLPLRVRVDQHASARSLLEAVRNSTVALRAHEHAPLTPLLAGAGIALSTLVVVERYDLDTAMRARGGRDASRAFALFERSDFPLVLAAYEDGAGARLALEHDARTLPREDALLLLEHVGAAVRELGRAARDGDGRPLALLPIFSEGEPERLARWGRGPEAGLVSELGQPSLVERFLALGRRRGDEIAVRDGAGTEISRRELLERARRLAAAMSSAGAEENEVVFVLLPRSIRWVAAMWATWLSGCVYVPLDASAPEERLRTVHDDVLEGGAARRPIVVTDRSGAALAQRALPRAEVLDVDDAWDHPFRGSAPGWGPREAGEASEVAMAYLLYTSGTTGRPKGSRISHRALAAHASAVASAFALGPSDRVLQFTALGFDVSIEETVPTLLAGARLVLRSDKSAQDLDVFVREVAAAGVTVLNLPSAFLHELLVHLEQRGSALPRSVRLVVVGGERPSPESWARLARMNARAEAEGRSAPRFINAYGPTEVTITSVLCDVGAAGVAADGRAELPIGRPLGTCRAYVVRVPAARVPREGGRLSLPPAPVSEPALASIEEPGELWLAGPQLAHGYLARPEATAQAFVADPFAAAADLDRTAYRTGDLVKHTRSGEIVFLGRMDRQLKLRGHRIEPSEIESALLAHPGVRDAAVVLAGEAERRALVGFVTSNVALELEAIRAGLAKRLPAVMIPSLLLPLAELPLAPTGKVDRAALESRARAALEDARERGRWEEPRNDLEAWLRPHFAHVLGRDDVDLLSSFFDMGGHSLLAIRLLGRLTEERPDLKLELATLFAHPSVRALADALAGSRPGEASTLVRLNPIRSDIEGEVPFFGICGVQLYGPLARAMGADRPVYGAFLPIEASAVQGRGAPLDVRAMAEDYVALVQRHRPRGPYLLGGVSFGGLLAYEMAQVLSARGEEVALLALFDAILPRAFERASWLARARAGLRRLRGPDSVLESIRRGARGLGGRARPEPGGAGEAEQAEALRDAVLKDAAERYDALVRPYAGPVVIFRARDGLDDDEADVRWDLGWTGLVPVSTPVHGVVGDHLGILRDPGVIEVAATLRAMLSRAGRASIVR